MKVVPAYKCTDDINNFLYLNQQNKKYENLFINNWLAEVKEEVETWNRVSFCFYDKDKLIGWLFLSTSRPANILAVESLCIINTKFTVSIFRFVFKSIKERMNKIVPKVNFKTLSESYADKIWRKVVKKYNGRVVGIQKNQCFDQQGNYRGIVIFEIDNPKFKERR